MSKDKVLWINVKSVKPYSQVNTSQVSLRSLPVSEIPLIDSINTKSHAFPSSTIENIHATLVVNDLGKNCERDYFENKPYTGNEFANFFCQKLNSQ